MFNRQFLKRRISFLLQAILFSVSFFLTPHLASANDRLVEDAFCKSKLAGTVSQETCAATCPGGARDCAVIQRHNASINPSLTEDLECYGCTSKQTCYDLGLIYGWPDCPICEANPFKKCVKSRTMPVIGGSISLPKDSDGVQCWDCVDDPDTCWKHWAGSTERAACRAACKKPNHKCVKVGVNPDNGYNCYRCVDMTPPKKCTDMGYIYQAQCNTCPANKPKCVPAVSIWFGGAVTDGKGAPCYECVKGPKSCKERGLQVKCAADEICEKVTTVDGVKCCNCKKKPKTCKDYKMRNPPCNCKEGEIKVERLVNSTQRKKIKCCDCKKDPCHPDLKESDCKACEAKGGKCEPITRVRGKPQCYRCVMPKKEPKNCEELEMPDSCSPNPCPEGYNCEMTDMGGFKCAECNPGDTVRPTHCDDHPTHKVPFCEICLNAQMTCDTVKVSDNPPLFCHKCLQPYYQRCPQGTIEGYCSGPWCVGGLKCVNANIPDKQCHYCLPNEECAPGRYRTPNCDNKCVQGKEVCRRIEGCEFPYAEDPRDLAVIDSMSPEDKYCGPDVTGILLTSLNRIETRMRGLSDNEKGAIDGTMFLDKNGMNIDLRASPINNSQGTQVCPSKPCMAGTMKSVLLCGKCVMAHIANDILYGFISNQVDVPWHIQLLGAHYAEYTSYGGLDPLPSQAAYMMGNDASEKMKKGPIHSPDDLCKILNKSGIKTGALTTTNGFELMTAEQGFLKDCKPCKFTETKVLKDFSEGDWKLEDGAYDKYTPQRGMPEYCCYACFPVPTDTAVTPPSTPVSSVPATLGTLGDFASLDSSDMCTSKSYFDIEYTIDFSQIDCDPETDAGCSYDEPTWAIDVPAGCDQATGQGCTDFTDIFAGTEGPIFTDGFESGDVSSWSAAPTRTAAPSGLAQPRTQTIVAVQAGQDIAVTDYTITNEGADRLRVTPSSQTTGRGAPAAGYEAFVDYGALEFDITTLGDPNRLIGAGGLVPSFQGFDRATGHFGDLSFTNFYNSPIEFNIPIGSYFNPFAFDVQRMTTTKEVSGTLQPGQTATFPLEGACLDAGLHPPPSGKATGDFNFSGPLFNQFNMFGDVLGGGSGNYNFFDAYSCQGSHVPMFSFDTSTLTSDMLISLEISPDIFREQFLIPSLKGVLDNMYAAGTVPPTGLPQQMEYETLLQWLIWEMTDDFDKEEGLARITDQVRKAGGTQTPEQIKTLNENIWKSIGVVKNKAIGSPISRQNTVEKDYWATFKRNFQAMSEKMKIEQVMSMMSFEREAFAQDAAPDPLKVEVNNTIHRLETALFLAQNITFEIEKLIETPYSKRIAKTKTSLAKPIRNKLDNIQKKVQESRPIFTEVRALTDDDFNFIVNKKNALVKKGGDIHRLWKDIQKRLKSVYPKWEKDYKKMFKRSQALVKSGKEYADGFSKDERQFFKVFSRLKLYYTVLKKIYE